MEKTNNKVIRHLRGIISVLKIESFSPIPSTLEYTQKGVPFVKILHRGQHYRICYFIKGKFYKVFENGVKILKVNTFEEVISFCVFRFLPSLPPHGLNYRRITKEDFLQRFKHRIPRVENA